MIQPGDSRNMNEILKLYCHRYCHQNPLTELQSIDRSSLFLTTRHMLQLKKQSMEGISNVDLFKEHPCGQK